LKIDKEGFLVILVKWSYELGNSIQGTVVAPIYNNASFCHQKLSETEWHIIKY